MKKTLLITLSIISIGISACRKNSGGLSTAGTPVGDSYLPVASGSTWKYAELISGSAPDSLTIKMTGATANFNGKAYYTGAASSKLRGPQNAYYYASAHLYAELISDPSVGNVELQIGNDSLAVGQTWITSPNASGEVNGVPAQCVNTLKEKNITKVIGKQTFKNVIHTQIDLQYDYGDGFQSATTYDFYLAAF